MTANNTGFSFLQCSFFFSEFHNLSILYSRFNFSITIIWISSRSEKGLSPHETTPSGSSTKFRTAVPVRRFKSMSQANGIYRQHPIRRNHLLLRLGLHAPSKFAITRGHWLVISQDSKRNFPFRRVALIELSTWTRGRKGLLTARIQMSIQPTLA